MQARTVIENVATAATRRLMNTDGGSVTLDAESAVVENDPTNRVGAPACTAWVIHP